MTVTGVRYEVTGKDGFTCGIFMGLSHYSIEKDYSCMGAAARRRDREYSALLPQVNLPGNRKVKFFFTEKGDEKFKVLIAIVGKMHVSPVKKVVREIDKGDIVYRDLYQFVIEK